MDDIPLPGIAPDPSPNEPPAEFLQLPVEGPVLESEQTVSTGPQPLPENAPAPLDNSPAPLGTPPAPLEEAPAPPDSLVSFFQGSDTPNTDDMNSDDPVQDLHSDSNNVAPFLSTANLTDQPHLAAAACVDGTRNVFGENHLLQNTMPNVPVPVAGIVGPQPASLEENQAAQLSVGEQPTAEVQNPEAAAAVAALAAPPTSVEAYPVQYAEQGADPQQVVTDPALQNSQVQYSASYMGYPQMSDPSMMHNYSYMANSYSDYMSMYHAGRMSRYPNTYASYQGYNYSYPHMQQMYDGRNMAAAYATGSYSQQMLPGSTSMMSNFTPPLPTDYKAPSFSSEPPRAQKPAAKPKAEAIVESELPPLPKGAMPEQPKEKADVASKPEDGEPPAQPPIEVLDDDGSDRMVTDQDEPPDNFSEDVNRYSPSLPMDEDEANHQLGSVDENATNRSASKSSVLGKAQAKKRLMAFSISKQAAAAHIAAKKQAQTGGRDKKENGDPSGKTGSDEAIVQNENVFDDKHSKKKQKKSSKMEKARETIEEIEEIKRAEMTTMMYRQTLVNDSANDYSSDRRRDRNRRRSRSRSRSRRRSTSRSYDRKSRRGDKKYRRKSRSRSRSKSGSRSRSSSQVHKKPSIKTSDIKSWDDFVEAGFQLDRYRRVKFNENKNSLVSEFEIRKKEELKHSRYGERRSTSIEKEVIEEHRKRKINMFETPVELKKPIICTIDMGNMEEIHEFHSHIVQYTIHKPTLKYCQNPKYATLHFINRVQLLEMVPDDVALMIKRFWSTIRPKKLKEKPVHQREDGERSPSVDEGRSKCPVRWWSSDPLREDGENYIEEDEIEEDDEEIITFIPYMATEIENTTSVIEKPTPKLVEKPTSTGVRKSRFEDATEEKQGVSVVVRSRWDSDYEDSPKNINDVDLSVAAENTYRGSPKIDGHFSRLNSEGPALPPMEDPYQPKPVAPVPVEEISVSTFVNKKHVLIERRPRKNKDKSKRGSKDIRDTSESQKSKKSKSSQSPDEWREEVDYEPVEVPPPKEPKKTAEEEYADDTFENDKSGEHKLVSEYEEFLKMVSFEAPKNENQPLYEGPKPPPQQEGPKPPPRLEKLNDAEDTPSKSTTRDTNPSPTSDTRMEVDDEEDFDIDKFFMKEKEKKMKKLAESELSKKKEDFVSEVDKKKDEFVSELNKNKKKDDFVESDGEIESEVDIKRKKKRDKKDKPKKKKPAFKVKKLTAKNKKKQKEKKKKYESSSDSSDSSDDSDSEDSDSSDDSVSSDSSSSSSSNSSSSDHSSSDSASHKKRKRSKRGKKKDKKTERKHSDRSKKKKKKQKLKESEADTKKKKKKASKNDDKKKKIKKLPPENILELLAVSLKKNESEENDLPKKIVKEKRKKRKKKSERDKDDKVANALLDVIPAECSREFSEEKILAKMKELEKVSSLDTEKKKKKSKKKRSASVSEDEVPSWKKKKLIDPREIEESVAKAQMNPFFDDNLDDWDRLAASSAAEHSMRDDSKNELENKDAKKKKKTSTTKQKNTKRGSVKRDEKQREEKEKRKTVHKKKKKPTSKKPKKKYHKKAFLDKENKRPPSVDERNLRSPSIELNFEKSSPPLAKDGGSDLNHSPPSPDRSPAYYSDEYKSPKCDDGSQQLDVRPLSQNAERYSPTFCDADEDVSLSPANYKEKFQESVPFSAAPSIYNFQSSNLYPCFAPTDLQNISLPTAVPQPVPAPLPVPPPNIQPSHSFTSLAVKDSSLISTRESVVSSSIVNVTEPSVTISHSTTTTTNSSVSPNIESTATSDTDTGPKAFSNVVAIQPDNVSYKSFSVGKLEVKTKAAKKFVHSNIFDSFEAEEQKNKPEPLTPTKVPECAESLEETNSAVEEPDIPEEEVEKDEFRARPCIALPDLPASEREGTPVVAPAAADELPHSEATPVKTATAAVAESSCQPSSTEKRSRSRDRSTRSRNDRDSLHRDGYRRRSRSHSRSRTRSRSRSHSRSHDRYRKRFFRGRDRYKRSRPRDRSRSRSRRCSRDRDFKDHRYRHKRRSYSREPSKKISRRERTPPEMEPLQNPPYEEPAAPIMKDDRMMVDANYDPEYEHHYSEIRVRDSVTELSRRLHESQYNNADMKMADINALQANLYQLRETLMHLNRKEMHVDSLNSVISTLEAHKMPVSMHGLASGDPRSCNKPKQQLDIQNIINLCHAIQSSLPAVPPPMDGKPRNAVGGIGPRSPPDPYHSPLPKKSVADSTNGSYPPAAAPTAIKSRFEERSREISPKPLSLDERLELELGVKRTTPTSKKAPGVLPPAPHRGVPMNLPTRPYYPMQMYENGIPNFSTPPPPLHRFPPMMNAAVAAAAAAAAAAANDRNYYTGARLPPPLNWNNPPNNAAGVPFLRPNMSKIQPPIMLPPSGMLPRTMPPLPSEPKVPYRVPDPAGSKVHSIQVGNMLQIVPTELQPSSVSSQGHTKQPPLPPQAPATSTVGPPATTYSQAANSVMPGAATFSSLLSAHLPVSFAAAPAVSGSKAKAPNNSRPSEVLSSNDQKHANDFKSKLKEPHLPPAAAAPPTVTPPPIGSSGSKISNLPLPPGTSDAEMKKLIRLAREKRLLKLRGANDSPATPTSDDSSLLEDQENNDEPMAPIAIKPSPEQGILISPGFKDKSTPVTALGRSIIGSSRKMVSFVDGVRPGAPTVSDSPPTKVRKPSPPPKKKHKVRVKIIRPEDSSDDDDSPPPPPPGPPPPELYPPTGVAALGLLPPGYMLPKL